MVSVFQKLKLVIKPIKYFEEMKNTLIQKPVVYIQLGQLSVIPPGLVLEAGGTSTLQAAMPVKLKSPPTSRFQVGGTSALQA